MAMPRGPLTPTCWHRALADLPRRRRAILVAVLRGDGSRRTIAGRFGISVRTLEAEVRAALEHVLRHLDQTPD